MTEDINNIQEDKTTSPIIINNFVDVDKINRTIFFGDNLEILREKFPNVGGYFDLVYLDPPFNSNRNYNQFFEKGKSIDCNAQSHAFEDTWTWNAESEVVFDYLTSSSKVDIKIHDLMNGMMKIIGKNDMMAYLTMMTIRLIELHRVLKDTGSIYLHCDPHASHYLKLVMDQVFGYNNFRNEIVWSYQTGGASKERYARKHDIILFYTRSDKWTFNYLEIKEMRTEKSLERAKNPKGARFSADNTMKNPTDIFNIQALNPMAKERLGYPTQKPEALLERIILASSNPGDIVLDPFCGCGTTVTVAEKLGRNWVGIDITTLAIQVIKERLADQFTTKFDNLNVKVRIDGLPKDMHGAITLAEKCEHDGRFNFQYWVLGLLGAIPTKGKSKDNKKGKDEGIDGIIIYKEEDETKKLIISVKSGKTPHSNEVRDLKGVVDREKASGGIFVTLYPPTKDMIKEAVVSGTYDFYSKKFQKIQIVTVEDLFNNKYPDIPHTQESPYEKAKEMPEQPCEYIKITEDIFA